MHFENFLICLELTRLIADDSLCAVYLKSHQRTAECVIDGASDHMEWPLLVCIANMDDCIKLYLTPSKERWKSAFRYRLIFALAI